jgi:hypothetical protein
MSNCDAVQLASLKDHCRKQFQAFDVLAMFHQDITLDHGSEEEGDPPTPHPRDPVSAPLSVPPDATIAN